MAFDCCLIEKGERERGRREEGRKEEKGKRKGSAFADWLVVVLAVFRGMGGMDMWDG